MNNTDTNWHMIFVDKGQVLPVHTELERLISNNVGRPKPLAGSELWTPFTRVPVMNISSGRKKKRAEAKFHRLMFIRLACREQRMVISEIVNQRKYIKGPVLSPATSQNAGNWYHVPQSEMDRLQEYHGASFDPKRDARFNSKRVYGQQDVIIPEFTAGQRVEYFSGPMRGVEFEVLYAIDDIVKLKSLSKSAFSGIEASAFQLQLSA